MFRPMAHHPHVMARGLASLGRGGDSTLVHMTPKEVMGLQKLALKHGGSLTINPKTGLPEAGFLSSILPALLGGAASIFGPGMGITGGMLTALEMGAGAAGGKIGGQGYLAGAFQGKMGAGLAESFMDTGTQTAVDAASKSAMADNAATQEAAHAAAVKNASDMISQQIDPEWANNSQIQNAIGQIDAPVYPEKVPFSTATQAAIDKIPTSRGSAFNAGIGNLASGDSPLMPFLKSNSGKLLGLFGPALLSSMSKNNQVPAQTESPFYNTTYQRKMVYGPGGQPIMVGGFTPGSWSTQYAGPGYQPVAGKDQTGTPTNPYGSANNPYTGIAANIPAPNPNAPYPTVYDPYTGQPVFGAKRGGTVRHYDEGGSTSGTNQASLDAMHQKYANLLAAQRPAPPDPTALNNYLAPLTAKPYDPNWKGPGNGGSSAVVNGGGTGTGGGTTGGGGGGSPGSGGGMGNGYGGAGYPSGTSGGPTGPDANILGGTGATGATGATGTAGMVWDATKGWVAAHPNAAHFVENMGLNALVPGLGTAVGVYQGITNPPDWLIPFLNPIRKGLGFETLLTKKENDAANAAAKAKADAAAKAEADAKANGIPTPSPIGNRPIIAGNGGGGGGGGSPMNPGGFSGAGLDYGAGSGGGNNLPNVAVDFNGMSPYGGVGAGNGGPGSGYLSGAHGGHVHTNQIHRMAHGGIADLMPTYAAGGKLLKGDGDGMSDSIPAVIGGQKPQRAALADGEFVVPADVVSHLGNGSTSAGAKKLYAMMHKIRLARTGNPKQGKQINPDKFLPV